MENKADVLDVTNDYEKLVDELGKEIASLYESCGAVREIVQQVVGQPEVYKRFGTFFYKTYCSLLNDLYHGISRLVDDSKGVISVVKLLNMKEHAKPAGRAELAGIEKKIVDQIKRNEVAAKVKNFRNKKLGHKNKQLILDQLLEGKFREENKLQMDDIENLLHLLSSALNTASERAGFHVLTIPVTSIRKEISSMFDVLSRICSDV